tara:strand:+ start:6825 stop:6950 length:126 start_codon:yes stop_codon:yes gene_type:complete
MDERVNMLSGRLGLLIEAARAMNDSALAQATWEPHNWGDFS